jgi:coenzyme Q-binding protein COQ10
MPSFKTTKTLPYPAKHLYDIVMDIEKYPEFLPWCKQAKITKINSDSNLEAILLINFKNFFEKYTSSITHGLNESGYFVNVEAIEGPFKNLINQWRLQDTKNGCMVEFHIDFQFNSFLLEKMIGAIFEKATLKMMGAFEVRANDIIKANKQPDL